MIYFARAVGAARTGNGTRAKADVDRLVELREALLQSKDGYWAGAFFVDTDGVVHQE